MEVDNLDSSSPNSSDLQDIAVVNRILSVKIVVSLSDYEFLTPTVSSSPPHL